MCPAILRPVSLPPPCPLIRYLSHISHRSRGQRKNDFGRLLSVRSFPCAASHINRVVPPRECVHCRRNLAHGCIMKYLPPPFLLFLHLFSLTLFLALFDTLFPLVLLSERERLQTRCKTWTPWKRYIRTIYNPPGRGRDIRAKR